MNYMARSKCFLVYHIIFGILGFHPTCQCLCYCLLWGVSSVFYEAFSYLPSIMSFNLTVFYNWKVVLLWDNLKYQNNDGVIILVVEILRIGYHWSEFKIGFLPGTYPRGYLQGQLPIKFHCLWELLVQKMSWEFSQ